MNYHIANGRVVLSATPTRSIEGSEAWIAENLNTIKALLKQSGAVKITGLNWQAAEHFHRLYRQLIAQPIQYSEKATPRTRLHHNVFTSTDLPAIQNIALHNENSYTNRFPGKLLFGCLQPPESGGETTTCDMRQVYAQMTDELKQKFAKGWLLRRTYHPELGIPWKEALGVDNEKELAAYCQQQNIQYHFHQGKLVTEQVRSCHIQHLQTQEYIWFNHINFWNINSMDEEVRDVLLYSYGEEWLPYNTYHHDGTAIEKADIEAIQGITQSLTVSDPWEKGDLLLVDNLSVAHGRNSYQGERNILVSMGDPVTRSDVEAQ